MSKILKQIPTPKFPQKEPSVPQPAKVIPVPKVPETIKEAGKEAPKWDK